MPTAIYTTTIPACRRLKTELAFNCAAKVAGHRAQTHTHRHTPDPWPRALRTRMLARPCPVRVKSMAHLL